MAERRISGLSIAGFVISLVALITFLIAPFSIILSLISLVLSIISLYIIKKRYLRGKGFAIAGIIISVIALLLAVIVLVLAMKEIRETNAFLKEVREATTSPLVLFDQTIYYDASGDLNQRAFQTIQILIGNQVWIDSYKENYDLYPSSLKEVSDKGYNLTISDSYGQLIYNLINDDKYYYSISSRGLDGQYGTADDIILYKKKII